MLRKNGKAHVQSIVAQFSNILSELEKATAKVQDEVVTGDKRVQELLAERVSLMEHLSKAEALHRNISGLLK